MQFTLVNRYILCYNANMIQDMVSHSLKSILACLCELNII